VAKWQVYDNIMYIQLYTQDFCWFSHLHILL